jgi:hypothetical protein
MPERGIFTSEIPYISRTTTLTRDLKGDTLSTILFSVGAHLPETSVHPTGKR